MRRSGAFGAYGWPCKENDADPSTSFPSKRMVLSAAVPSNAIQFRAFGKKFRPPLSSNFFIVEERRYGRSGSVGQCKAQLAHAVDLVCEGDARRGAVVMSALEDVPPRCARASEIPPHVWSSNGFGAGIYLRWSSALHRSIEGAEDQPESSALCYFPKGACAKGDVVAE
jgi:hypothetical protein